MTREEHLNWCKERALEYVDAGELTSAFTSFASDVGKHPETEQITGVISSLGLPLLLAGHLATKHKMREYINGYN